VPLRPGFYPAGGGEIHVTIAPAKRLTRLDVTERGAVVNRRARAVVANLPYNIAQREVQTIAAELGWDEPSLQAHTLTGSIGPGNAVSITIESEHITEVFTAFGARGVRAEDVAKQVASEAKRYLDSGAAVGEHLADQLLLPMAIGEGGAFTTPPLSGHTATNMEIIRRFVEVTFDAEEAGEGVIRLGVTPVR